MHFKVTFFIKQNKALSNSKYNSFKIKDLLEIASCKTASCMY